MLPVRRVGRDGEGCVRRREQNVQRRMVKTKQGSLGTLSGVVSTPVVWGVRVEGTEMIPRAGPTLKGQVAMCLDLIV